jgi:hypothetical protein
MQAGIDPTKVEDIDPARPGVWAICGRPSWLPDEGDPSERTRQGAAATAEEAMRVAEAAFTTPAEQAEARRLAEEAWAAETSDVPVIVEGRK